MTVLIDTLPNGLRLVVCPMPGTRSTAVVAAVDAGSRHEHPDEAGLAHFLEHALFAGTERRPSPRAIDETVETIGGQINAETSAETAVVWSRVPRGAEAAAIDLVADLVRRPAFPPAEITRARRVIRQELTDAQDDSGKVAQNLIHRLTWPDHPLGREILGTVESVRGATRDRLLGYWQRRFHPANTVVGIAGAVDPDRVRDRVAVAWADWVAREADPSFVPAPDPLPGPFVRVRSWDSLLADLTLAVPGLAEGDPDWATLEVLRSILGGGATGRLPRTLREERGLAYHIHCGLTFYRETGLFSITASVSPKRVHEVIERILGEIATIDSLSPAELAKSRELAKSDLIFPLDDPLDAAQWYAERTVLGLCADPDATCAAIDRVTADDVIALTRRLFHPAALRLAIVGPVAPARHFKAELERLGAVLSENRVSSRV